MSPELFVLIVHHVGDPAEVEKHTPGHIAYLEKHHAAGVFVLSGQTRPEEYGGVILARGVTRAELDAVIAEDPFVRSGVSEYTVFTMGARRAHPDVLKAVRGEIR
ncbi:hypothetical protein QR97_37445 [Streptomyces sp. PBH53]|uniref:YciI family protein n=1 Tax=Streptomyces tricolor TaxID=68277 RepID=A0ABS9JI83_9ACTN|nr:MULTISPECIES: YciI family protein [Streptomyces]AKN74647.1 hypothetical protein QR97_37445 [Streptomyces sp. PBH53]MCG0065266.1 YciI family protein [Streptomyces tricolor]OYP13422.1 hypothetical protein CFC35_02035 [Streptomyces sp. FBKL.4005]